MPIPDLSRTGGVIEPGTLRAQEAGCESLASLPGLLSGPHAQLPRRETRQVLLLFFDLPAVEAVGGLFCDPQRFADLGPRRSGYRDILWGQRPSRTASPEHTDAPGCAPDEWRPSTCVCPLLLGESAELQVVAGLGFDHVRRVADQEFVLVFRRQVAEEYIHNEAVLEGYEAPGQESGWR